MEIFVSKIPIIMGGFNDAHSADGQVEIIWTLDYKKTNEGLKDFTIEVPDQKIQTVLERHDIFANETMLVDTLLDIKDVEVDISNINNGIFPLELSFNKGIYELRF